MKLISFIGMIIWIIFADALYASRPYTPKIEDPILEPWRWRHFYELDGKGVRSILEDQNHTMWFGCDVGVIRYDGLNWVEYDTTSGLISVPVIALQASDNGSIYAGSAGGISIFKENHWTALFPEKPNPELTITKIIQLNDHSVLAAGNKGLFHFKNERLEAVYTVPNHITYFQQQAPDSRIIEISEDFLQNNSFHVCDVYNKNDSTLWIAVGYDHGTSGRIIKAVYCDSTNSFNMELFHKEHPNKKYYNGTKLFIPASGALWSVTGQVDQSITIFTDSTSLDLWLGSKFGVDNIYSDVIQMRDGTIFVGGLGRFFAFREGIWKFYVSPAVPVPTSNRVLFYEDSKGDLWLIGKQNEVFMIEYTSQNWATHKNLNFHVTDHDGNRWFINREGRVIKNVDDKWISYGQEDGLISTPVRVFCTSYGELWVSGGHLSNAAVAYLSNGKWVKKIFPKLGWGIDARSVFEDYSGALWFGCNIDIKPEKGHQGGIIKFPDPRHKKDEFIHYKLPQTEVGVYGIGQSKDGIIWVAGVSGCYFDSEQWHATHFPKEFIYHTDCIYTSEDSILWVGSRNYGLFRFDGREWRNFNMSTGLNSNSVTSIFAESDTCVWISTSKGISRYDGYSWTTDIFPRQLDIVNEGGEIRKSGLRSLWINKSSRIWNRRGEKNISETLLNEQPYWTVYYKQDEQPPETDIVRYEEEVSQTGNTIITWSGKDPYSRTAVENLQYSYRIDENEWTSFSSETSHFFSELKSGLHTLEVRARDMDFNIDPTPVKIEFEVMYPIYLRREFLIPVGLLTMLSIFLLVRVVRKSRQLRQAKRETDNILQNVEEGLFLLDNKFNLGSQYSEFLKGVFNEENMANKSLIQLLSGKISPEELDSVQSYLNIMFRKDTDENMLEELNPLSNIKFDYGKDLTPRYFSFRFRNIPVLDKNILEHNLIVVVQDITEQINLGKKLQKAQQDADRKMKWLLSILHVDPAMLQEFIASADNELVYVSEILNAGNVLDDFSANMEKIYRSMHLMKGNASLLSLDLFAEETHKYEDKISELQKKEKPGKDDIEALKTDLESIKASIVEITSLLDRISEIHNQMRTKRGFEKKLLVQSLKNLIDDASKSEHKKVKLKYDQFNIEEIPYQKRLLIKEFLIQFIRNSIAHGIELPKDRKKNKKPECGEIQISTFKNENEYGIIYSDDGRGLQLDKLKEKALKSGKWKSSEIESWSRDQLAELIFISGISTSDAVTIVSGRGVGLDMVKHKLDQNNGEIIIDSREGQYCRFTVKFTAEAEKE